MLVSKPSSDIEYSWTVNGMCMYIRIQTKYAVRTGIHQCDTMCTDGNTSVQYNVSHALRSQVQPFGCPNLSTRLCKVITILGSLSAILTAHSLRIHYSFVFQRGLYDTAKGIFLRFPGWRRGAELLTVPSVAAPCLCGDFIRAGTQLFAHSCFLPQFF